MASENSRTEGPPAQNSPLRTSKRQSRRAVLGSNRRKGFSLMKLFTLVVVALFAVYCWNTIKSIHSITDLPIFHLQHPLPPPSSSLFGARPQSTQDTEDRERRTEAGSREMEYNSTLLSNDIGNEIRLGALEKVKSTDKGELALASQSAPTSLALLYPIGMLGGYRNQVIRFVSLAYQAQKRKIPTLFLPSLYWTTSVRTPQISQENQAMQKSALETYPIPMEEVFDIDIWNEVASRNTSRLPLIEKDTGRRPSDCWRRLKSTDDEKDSLHHAQNLLREKENASGASLVWPIETLLSEHGYISGLLDETVEMMTNTLVNLRRRDYLANVSNCTNPYFYGGGTHIGRLWKDAMHSYDNLHKAVELQTMEALHPARRWRNAATQCLERRGVDPQRYIAVHARIELDMMDHPCGKTMEGELSKILDQVQNFVNTQEGTVFEGVLLVVSRSGIIGEGFGDRLFRRFSKLATDNLRTLSTFVNATGFATDKRLEVNSSNGMRVVQCGSFALQEHYEQMKAGEQVRQLGSISNHGTLVEAVINFYLALNAPLFIGVKRSSYSAHVLRTRYLQGKGASNFYYTKEEGAIQPVENGGMPDRHTTCSRKR